MELISPRELRSLGKGPFAGLLSLLLMRLLGLQAINRLYRAATESDKSFAAAALEKLQISYLLADADRAQLPAKGAAILIANHPTGALDGLLLIDALCGVRPDVRFMGNFLLDRITPLRHYFINVDPFEERSRNNAAGIRCALHHLRQGGMLVIFPAGEVSSWQHGCTAVADRKWPNSILKFIRRADVPVIPLWIEARNSLLFRLAGKLHPRLRTALLPHELLNKRGKTVSLSVGSPISPSKTAALGAEAYSALLRLNGECLRPLTPQRKANSVQTPRSAIEAIVGASPGECLEKEIATLRADLRLLEYGEYELFCTPPERIPLLMQEIGRLREITFREIGEGTNQQIDTDRYDGYYHQLFIWDRSAARVVGAYRMGLGEQIMQGYGLEGFYTHSLFRMDPAMGSVMKQTIELGRSFIVRDYQRKPVSLMLLWKGILQVLLRHDQYRYLMGPVTISGEFCDTSKLLIARYLSAHHLDSAHATLIHPRTGMVVHAALDAQRIEKLDSIEWINKLVCDIERNRFSVPVLIRKYLQVGSRVLAFNTDHDFCDALDALMLLDLAHVPEKTIQMLSKEMEGIDLWERFNRYREASFEEVPHS